MGGVRQRPRGERVSDELSGSPRPGLHKYLSRFDEAMKLRGQLASEKAAVDAGDEPDPFGAFRLVASVLLALFVRVFVCRFLVSESPGRTQALSRSLTRSSLPSPYLLLS